MKTQHIRIGLEILTKRTKRRWRDGRQRRLLMEGGKRERERERERGAVKRDSCCGEKERGKKCVNHLGFSPPLPSLYCYFPIFGSRKSKD